MCSCRHDESSLDDHMPDIGGKYTYTVTQYHKLLSETRKKVKNRVKIAHLINEIYIYLSDIFTSRRNNEAKSQIPGGYIREEYFI